MINLTKTITTALLCSLIFSANVAYARTVKHFQHTFDGITLGKSNQSDVIQKFGKPAHTKKKGHSTNNHYKFFIVNLNKKKRVNSIIFHKKSRYHDVNGIAVGDSIDKVKARISSSKNSKGKFLVDNNDGIIYWHNGSRVTKIVLAESFYID